MNGREEGVFVINILIFIVYSKIKKPNICWVLVKVTFLKLLQSSLAYMRTKKIKQKVQSFYGHWSLLQSPS